MNRFGFPLVRQNHPGNGPLIEGLSRCRLAGDLSTQGTPSIPVLSREVIALRGSILHCLPVSPPLNEFPDFLRHHAGGLTSTISTRDKQSTKFPISNFFALGTWFKHV